MSSRAALLKRTHPELFRSVSPTPKAADDSSAGSKLNVSGATGTESSAKRMRPSISSAIDAAGTEGGGNHGGSSRSRSLLAASTTLASPSSTPQPRAQQQQQQQAVDPQAVMPDKVTHITQPKPTKRVSFSSPLASKPRSPPIYVHSPQSPPPSPTKTKQFTNSNLKQQKLTFSATAPTDAGTAAAPVRNAATNVRVSVSTQTNNAETSESHGDGPGVRPGDGHSAMNVSGSEDMNRLREQVLALKTEVKETKALLEDSKLESLKQRETLNTRIGELESRVQAAAAAVASLTSERDTLATKAASFKKALEKSLRVGGTKRHALEEQMQTLENDLRKQLQDKEKESLTVASELKSAKVALRAQASKLDTALASADINKHKTLQELSTARTDLAAARSEVAALTKANVGAERRASLLENESLAMTTQLTSLQQQLDRIRSHESEVAVNIMLNGRDRHTPTSQQHGTPASTRPPTPPNGHDSTSTPTTTTPQLSPSRSRRTSRPVTPAATTCTVTTMAHAVVARPETPTNAHISIEEQATLPRPLPCRPTLDTTDTAIERNTVLGSDDVNDEANDGNGNARVERQPETIVFPVEEGLTLSLKNSLLSNAACFDSVRRMSLRGTDADDSALEYLSDLVGLQHLDMGRTRVTSQGLKHLIPLQALSCLSLEACVISDPPTSPGIAPLIMNRNLALLSLAYCTVSDATVPLLAACPSLQVVDIVGTCIQLPGLRSLVGRQRHAMASVETKQSLIRSLRVSPTVMQTITVRNAMAVGPDDGGPSALVDTVEGLSGLSKGAVIMQLKAHGLEFNSASSHVTLSKMLAEHVGNTTLDRMLVGMCSTQALGDTLKSKTPCCCP